MEDDSNLRGFRLPLLATERLKKTFLTHLSTEAGMEIRQMYNLDTLLQEVLPNLHQY